MFIVKGSSAIKMLRISCAWFSWTTLWNQDTQWEGRSQLRLYKILKVASWFHFLSAWNAQDVPSLIKKKKVKRKRMRNIKERS